MFYIDTAIGKINNKKLIIIFVIPCQRYFDQDVINSQPHIQCTRGCMVRYTIKSSDEKGISASFKCYAYASVSPVTFNF